METFVDQSAKYGLHTLGEKKGQLKVIYSFVTILDERIDTNKQLAQFNFIFIDSQNHRFSYHAIPNALLLGTRATLLNIGQVTG